MEPKAGGRRLNVALDMTFANRNQGGTGVYSRSLLAALRERDDVVPWVIEGPRSSNLPMTMRWLLQGARRQLVARPPDVLHCPAFVAPWSIKVPMVITVHDSAGSRFPRDHPLEWRVYVRRLMPERLRSASRVITVSNFGRSEVIEVYGLDPASVVVVPEGLDPRFFAPHKEPTPPQPVLLFPGAPIGRKNLELVLRCMSEAPANSCLARASLQISGAREQDFPDHARQIRALGMQGRVRWLGQVDFALMPALYASVSGVVYPSIYEGFGFPPLESMAVGTPVVASNRGSLPEVLGDGALLIDPSDDRGWSEALEAVLGKPDLRHELVERGRRQARAYTWQKCAALTVDVYREAAATAR